MGEQTMKRLIVTITASGPPGCRKSSVIDEMERILCREGFVVRTTKEPHVLIAERVSDYTVNPLPAKHHYHEF